MNAIIEDIRDMKQYKVVTVYTEGFEDFQFITTSISEKTIRREAENLIADSDRKGLNSSIRISRTYRLGEDFNIDDKFKELIAYFCNKNINSRSSESSYIVDKRFLQELCSTRTASVIC